MKKRQLGYLAGALLVVLVSASFTAADDVAPLLLRIKAVGREGAGNSEAAKAWEELNRQGPEDLTAILAGLDDADLIAANWLRAAVDSIAERTVENGQPLPAARLEAFVKQTEHAGRARRLAYEWLVHADPSAPARLLPGMLHDPSGELRRDAVALVLTEAQALLDKGDRPAATAAYRKALSGACDKDQVDLLVNKLKPLGIEVDTAHHLGFVGRWLLVAPFDNSGGTGFQKVFPPEEKADPAATYPGKGGTEAHWIEHVTNDPYGIVDLNKALGKQKGVTAYALAVIDSPTARPVQVRVGCITALKVFLNGRLLSSREEYHHGMSMDQYTARGTLQAGRNELLLKVCQNEQTEEWAQSWNFQARLCDEAGAAVPFTIEEESPRESNKEQRGEPK